MPYLESKITVLTCNQKGKQAAKKFVQHEDGSIEKIDYNAGKFFAHEEVPVSNLEELAKVLDSLSTEPKKFIIRGEIKEGMKDVVRRKCHEPDAAFDSAPRPYVMLDIDKLSCPDFFDAVNNPEEIIAWLQASLPEPFRGVSCYYQFSSSQNVPHKTEQLNKGKVSVHLWLCCDRSVTDDEWKRYFKSISSPVDLAIFSPVQPHFTANPIFENMPDPLPKRSGIFKGNRDVVAVPKIPEPDTKKYANRSEIEPVISEEDCKKALELLRPYYEQGSRNRFSGAIAATLYRGGWKAENAADFVYKLAEAASDTEIESRHKNALSICYAVENNFPAQGILTLRDEFKLENLDEILSLLRVGGNEIQNAVSKLNNSSNIFDIKQAMKRFIHLSKSQQRIYIDQIKAKTKQPKTTLDAILKELKKENNLALASDSPDIAMECFLAEKYAGGDHLLKSSDGRFYRYNSKCWEYMPTDLLKNELLSYARQVVIDMEKDNVARNISDAISILSGRVYRKIDPFRQINRDVPPVINCQNGEAWFGEDGSVTLKPHRPESYLRSCLEVKYNPDATSPMFDEAALDIFSESSDPQDMFRHFMELAGYICQPWRKLAIIVLLYGGGSNGKTSLVGIIRRIMGENTIMSGRLGDIEKSAFKIGDLEGKLMVLDDDVDGQTYIPDGFLKKISEEKPMTGEHKFKQPFEFICRAVPVMLANDYPVTGDLTYGLRRRLLVTPFERTFKPDEIVVDKFDKIWEQEASGILNHIITGFSNLRKRGKFKEPIDCIRAKGEWITRSNILTTFIDEECEKNDELNVYFTEFYDAFYDYCVDTKVRNTMQRKTVKSKLMSLGYRISLLNGKDAVWGLELKQTESKLVSNPAKPKL